MGTSDKKTSSFGEDQTQLSSGREMGSIYNDY